MKTAEEFIFHKVERSSNLNDWDDLYKNHAYMIAELEVWMEEYAQQLPSPQRIDRKWINEILDNTNDFAKQLIKDHFDLHSELSADADVLNQFPIITTNPTTIEEEEDKEYQNRYNHAARNGIEWFRSQARVIDLEAELKKFRNFWNKKNYVGSNMSLSDLKEYLTQRK